MAEQKKEQTSKQSKTAQQIENSSRFAVLKIININEKETTELESILLTQNCVSIVYLEQGDTPAIHEPVPGTHPLWQKIQLQAYFNITESIDKQLLSIIKTIVEQYPHLEYELSSAPMENWVKKQRLDMDIIHIDEDLYIVPTTLEIKNSDAINIRLDAGIAFGTGQHPTTCLLLRWLKEQVKNNDTILDFGSGSGILSIAALLLGAKYVTAVEHCPQARKSSEDNLLQNNFTPSDFKVIDTPELINKKSNVNILTANVLAEPLIEHAELIANQVKSQGMIGLSGILKSQVDDIIYSYKNYANHIKTIQQDDWFAIILQKKHSE